MTRAREHSLAVTRNTPASGPPAWVARLTSSSPSQATRVVTRTPYSLPARYWRGRLSIAAASGGYPALFTVLAGAATAGAALAAIAPSPAGLGGLAAGSGGDGRQARREPPDTIG